MKIALAMICKGSNEEALMLDRCLGNMAAHVDGIFITRTHKKGEKPNEAVALVAKKYKATVSDFEWVYDFSAARNFNFAQVTPDYDYILWSDADDMWRGLSKLKRTIKAHGHVDAFGFWYSYGWDDYRKPVTVHKKTMLIKNDGGCKWVGRLHEDLEPVRQLDVELIEGIERLHISDADRNAESALRNIEIAQREMNDKPEDPRSYWNLANSQFGVADYKASLATYETFLATSGSQDEKYLAHMRLGDVYKALGRMDEGIRQLQIAIGLDPSIPDAYLQLAYYYFTMNDWDRAEKYSLEGIVRKPQKNKMIVFNPRDYDYNPLMLLAQIYNQKNRPHDMLTCLEGCLKIYPDDKNLKKMVADGKVEKAQFALALKQVQKLEKIKDKKKLKAAFDKLPPDLKAHPAVSVIRNKNFIKTESSGRDLAIYCGHTIETWNPEVFKTKGLGGSEEAVIHNARELAALGWNVTVYNNCGHKPMVCDGVTYRPFWEFNAKDKQDVLILWRWCKPLDHELNATKIFVDLHDVVPPGELLPRRLAKIERVFVKTKFHRSLFPDVPNDKIAIVPNGMQIYGNPASAKDEYLIINTSSPDRSLDVLPEIFAEIKKQVPQARLQWAYGWDGFKSAHVQDTKKLAWMNQTIKAMDEAGIETLGRLPQKVVGELYSKAKVFLYPTEFAEIDCISVKKAQASGCIAITTDFGALKESNAFGATVHSKKNKDTWNRPYQFHFGVEDEAEKRAFVSTTVAALKGLLATPNKEDLAEWTKQFAWSEIAKRWNSYLIK